MPRHVPAATLADIMPKIKIENFPPNDDELPPEEGVPTKNEGKNSKNETKSDQSYTEHTDEMEDNSIREIEELLKNSDLAGGKVVIHRRSPVGTTFAYLCTVEIADYEYETFKRIYGGGDYKASFRTQGGKVKAKRSFSIDPNFIGTFETRGASSSPLAAPSTNNGAPDLIELIKTLDSIRRPDTEKGDDLSLRDFIVMQQESQKTMITMMTGLFQAIQQKPATPVVNPMADLMPLLLAMISRPASPSSGVGEIVTAMRDMKKVMADDRDEDEKPEKSGGGLQTLLGMAPALLGLLAGGRGGQMPGVPPGMPIPHAPQAPQPAALPSTPTADPALQNFGAALGLIVEAARKNKDEGLYCDLLLDALPEDQLPALNQVLTSPDWYAQLFGQLPDATALRPWMDRLRALVLDALKPDADDSKPATNDPAPVRPAGDAGTIGVN